MFAAYRLVIIESVQTVNAPRPRPGVGETNMLQIQCLGDLTAVVDGAAVPALTNSKAAALWLYVALSGSACSRALLARMFWGELDEAASRANLRFVLTRLRQELPAHVQADRTTVSVPADARWSLDLSALDTPFSASGDSLAVLLALRIEDFLVGLRLRKAPEFEDWLSLQRETLGRKYLARLDEAADALRAAGDQRGEAEILRRALSVAPWSEQHHQALIRSYIDMGQRTSAIAQYEACRKALQRELDAAPDAATDALYEYALQTGSAAGPAPVAGTSVASASGAQPWPVRRVTLDETLPWVGRGEEQARIVSLLSSADARVVTLMGPGGIGKTHLALAVGALLSAHFADGACFVDLSDLAPQTGAECAALVAHRVAAALGIALPAGRERESLLEVLAPGRQLLILDNFEQVADARDLVAMLARHATGLRILVTSRHQLGLATEWIVRLSGLPFPDTDRWRPELRSAPAPSLFCELAHRQQPGFDADADGVHVLRLCRAVEGYPLGLVLAARWLATLSCRDVADRLCAGAHVLGEAPATLPENPRHSDMASVFDHSWRLLEPAEQQVLSALCMCRGGFTPDSALAFCGGTLAILAALTAKSLLQPARHGRLDVHPLLRDFGERKLLQSGANGAVRDAHAQHFLALLQAGHQRFEAHADTVALDALRAEQGNLRVVFDHLVSSGAVDALVRLLPGLCALYRMQGWFDELAGLLQRALAMQGLPSACASSWQLWLSDVFFQLGRHAECRAAALECLARQGDIDMERGAPNRHMLRELLRTLNGRWWRYGNLDAAAEVLVSRAHNRLAQVYFFEGDRPRFVASSLRSINIARAGSLPAHLASGALVLSYTPFKSAAARYAARAERCLDQAGMAEQAWTHEQLCLYRLARGDLNAARAHGQAGADIFWTLRQYRNWGECTALISYAHDFAGRIEVARTHMLTLCEEGRRVREAASELWGLLALYTIDLRIAASTPHVDVHTIDRLAARVVDPNTQLLRHGVLAWWYARNGRREEALSSVDTFCRAFDRATMTSIYALNGFTGCAMALVVVGHQETGDRRALVAAGESLFGRALRFARLLPAARPRVRYLQALWWMASGRHTRGERRLARVLNDLPADIDRAGFSAGLHLPREGIK